MVFVRDRVASTAGSTTTVAHGGLGDPTHTSLNSFDRDENSTRGVDVSSSSGEPLYLLTSPFTGDKIKV